MRGVAYGAALAGLTLASLALAPLAASAADDAPSADDCGVMAMAGKTQWKWAEAPPKLSMSPRSYGIGCDWATLGVAPPVVAPVQSGPYYEGLRFSFSRPGYAADGAHAHVTLSINGNAGPTSYFSESLLCTAEKRGGRWQAALCKMQFIT